MISFYTPCVSAVQRYNMYISLLFIFSLLFWRRESNFFPRKYSSYILYMYMYNFKNIFFWHFSSHHSQYFHKIILYNCVSMWFLKNTTNCFNTLVNCRSKSWQLALGRNVFRRQKRWPLHSRSSFITCALPSVC